MKVKECIVALRGEGSLQKYDIELFNNLYLRLSELPHLVASGELTSFLWSVLTLRNFGGMIGQLRICPGFQ